MQLLSGTLDTLMTALLDYKIRNITRVLYGFIVLAGVALSIFLGFGLAGVLISILLAYSLWTFINLFELGKKLFSNASSGTASFEWKRIIKFAFLNQLLYLGSLLSNFTFDIYLVGIFIGTTAAGWYAFAIKIAGTIIFYSPAIVGGTIIFPFLVKKYSETKSNRTISKFFLSYFKFTAFFVLPLALILVFAAKPIILLFGDKYLPSLLVFQISALAFGILGLESIFINICNVMEKTWIVVVSKAWFLLSLALNAYLLYTGSGISTVMLVTSAGIILMVITEYLILRKSVVLPLPFSGIARMLPSAALAAIPIYLFSSYGILALVLSFFASCILYALGSFLLKPFDSRDSEIFSRAGKISYGLSFFARK